tara:strand:- start:462 stop:614 length:153 start_codon:yes stop_codon:yes gene_type:complete
MSKELSEFKKFTKENLLLLDAKIIKLNEASELMHKMIKLLADRVKITNNN